MSSSWLNFEIIPVSRSIFFNHLWFYKEHGYVSDIWFLTRGAVPILNLDKAVESLTSDSSGKVLTVTQIESKLNHRLIKKAEQNNLSISTVNKVTRNTSKQYKALVSVSSNVNVHQKVTHKSGTRFTVDNSFMPTMCYLIVIASTYFYW